MFSIVISEKGGAERRETYDRSEINVGRVQGNDLMLPKGNVSKRHARLLFRDGRFIVTDLKSTNGTYVNGRKIAQATIVREGDKIYIGDFVLRIESGADGASAAASQSDAAFAPPPSPQGHQDAGLNEDSSGEGVPAAPGRAAPSAAPPPPPPPPQAPRPVISPQPQPRPTSPPQPPPTMQPGPPPPLMPSAPPAAPQMVPAAPTTGYPPPPAGQYGAPPPAYQPAAPPPAPTPQPQPPPMVQSQAAPAPPQMVARAPEPAFAAAMPPAIAPPPDPRPAVRPASMSGAPAGEPTGRPGPAMPPPGVEAPHRVSQNPASSGPAISAMPPTPMPSSKRVDQPPVDASQAAHHRALLGKLIERTSAAIDLSSLMTGEALDATKVAVIERALRDKVGTLAAEIPPGLSPDVLLAEAKRELCDLGPLGPLLEDEDVEEIQVIRHDHVVAIHDRRQIATEIAFTSEQAVARIVRRICVRANQPLAASEVFLERRMERGVRLFGVLPPASGDAHMLVFRKPRRAMHSLEDLVRAGTISRAIATLLQHAVALRSNILVTGAVNSGATQVLGALAAAGALDDRVIVLQEDDDLVFNQPHTVSILIGDTAEEGANAVRAAIRVRPDRLVVGAFAGHVVAEVVDAVGDGVDGVLAAARAPTLRHLCQRVPADLAATRGLVSVDTAREWIAAAFDLVVEVARLRDGRHRVMRVSEFMLDPKSAKELALRDIFTFTVERTAAGGALEGSFHATGEIPHIAEDLARGAPIDLSIFKRAAR